MAGTARIVTVAGYHFKHHEEYVNLRLMKKQIALKNIRVSVIREGHPPCFENDAQYKDWLESEAVVHTLRFRKNICEDCTSAYQNAMISQGKCVNKDFLVKN